MKINLEKFQVVQTEHGIVNFTNSSIIHKISTDSFSKRLFVYDKNYVSQPPHYNGKSETTRLDNLRHVDDAFLYKSYIHK